MLRNYTIGELKAQFARLKYPWPEDRYHLVGIRAPIKGDNQFDDLLCLVEQIPNRFTNLYYGIGTTVPGRFYLLNVMNPKGAAVLKEGQWKDCWKIGNHNDYQAFVQCAPVTVYRDNNKNSTPEEIKGSEETGIFGIDIHRAAQGFIAQFIDRFSAGCQVWDDSTLFTKILKLAVDSKQPTFTYTLLSAW